MVLRKCVPLTSAASQMRVKSWSGFAAGVEPSSVIEPGDSISDGRNTERMT